MKKTLLILIILFSISCFSQFSKTHFIPPLSGSNSVSAQDQFLYISTPSLTDVKVKINAIGVGITNVLVSKSMPYVSPPIGSGNDTQIMTNRDLLNLPLSKKGYIIEAESLVYVAVRINAGNYNQAGSLVSKGLSALGKQFRVGAFINTATTNTSPARYTFLSILATEDNTFIEFKDIKTGVTLINNLTVGNTPPPVTLNKGQSYVLATEDNSIANKDGLIGALVKSNKPIAFNCGSFGGTNGNNNTNLDLGFDQIVPIENIGKEYIFVRGFGQDITERPLLVAHEDNTEIFINEIPTIILNAGQYYAIDGALYGSNGTMYVRTTKPTFAYQSVGGLSQANQNLFFVPPLNCSTPSIVNNIPFIEKIGSINYTTNSGLNIVTETGATLQIEINGTNYPINSLPFGITATLKNISANTAFKVFSITGLTGNIGVFSDKQVYVSYFGSSGAATYGGYYSGFDLKPEIINEIKVGASFNCIPDVLLKISSLSSYDSFQWYKNNDIIPGATSNTHTPDEPGFYQVKGTNSNCGTFVFSDKIPVSSCPTNLDNDSANDNIDIDNDNDGILNCVESFGDQNIDVSNSTAGNITVIPYYANSFTRSISTTGTGLPVGTFTGNTDGSFITEIPAGKGNSVTYKMTFQNPISVGIGYVNSANPADLLNVNAEYVINSAVTQTVTVLNPDDELLIDTNNDGIYENGVKEYSSFEIRFRLNTAAAATGTFKFLSYLANSISFTHKNLSETEPNKSTLKFFATCIPKDYDGDGIPDQLDTDSDNDGILDVIEAQGKGFKVFSGTDSDNDGLDNAFEPGIIPIDTDQDGVTDQLDADSDNDGIYDLEEAGHNAIDTNKDGILDGSPIFFGTNGLFDALETAPDSGKTNYTISDTDSDGTFNHIDLDSDGDFCFDVIEAGFKDPNNDGTLGNNPVTVDSKGTVTSAIGYSTPSKNYTIAAPIIITVQPNVLPTCEFQNATVTLNDNGGNTYQWELSTDGITWGDIVDNTIYSGATTNTLVLKAVTNSMNSYKYRVQLSKTGNSCGLTSAETALTVYPLPIVKDIQIIQCGTDLSGFSTFNLTVKNNEISTDFANETFSYYTSLAGANTADATQRIAKPLNYTNTTPFVMPVWARVVNKNGCFRTAQITLQVLATQIPTTFKRSFEVCDDFLDINGANNANNNKRDGISLFDFSSVTTDIKALLPTTGNYSITYYRNQADALSEINVIPDISNYRNIGYRDTQIIWGRVDSNIDNACFGLGPYVNLTVEKLPFANPISIQRQCDDNQDGIFTFNTATLETTLLGTNQTFTVKVTYFDAANNPLKDANGILMSSPFPATFTSTSQIIKAVVTNATSLKCFDETNIQFIVDDLPEAFAVPVSLTTRCDEELDPLNQDGKLAFDTSTFQSIILNGQIGMNVKYFDQNGDPLSSPLQNPFVTSSQNVKVIVENPINTTCFAEWIIPFIVEPLPNISLNTDGREDNLVCSNIPTFFVTLDAGIQDGSSTSNYKYIWSKDGKVLDGKIAYTLVVNEEGLYTVKVFNRSDCSRIRSIKVTASDIATIQAIDIVDMTDLNSVTIKVTGLGDYEYSLDEASGYFQDSNFFDNVIPGIHEVFINDKNGCGTVSKTIAVTGVPKFFTPNGDGINDYWNVKGVNNVFNKNAAIYIFDRYGKLIKQITASSQGWDGTFTGNPLPSDDYWYTIRLDDGREAKGHFSLKR